MHSQKCVVRRLRRCANIIQCTWTNLDSIAYYTPRLYGISQLLLGYKPVQPATVLNTVGNCNTMVSIIILWDHRRVCGPSLCGTYLYRTNSVTNCPTRCNYTECNRKNGPDFRRVFLRSYYTDITQNTYIQSWTVTEILAREVWNFDSYYSW